jgi:hypothetical protein
VDAKVIEQRKYVECVWRFKRILMRKAPDREEGMDGFPQTFLHYTM